MTAGQERAGLVFAALCALNGAFVPAFAKLTTGRADPFFVAAATGVFAGIGCAVLLSLRGQLPELWRAGRGPKLAAAFWPSLIFFRITTAFNAPHQAEVRLAALTARIPS